MTRTASATHPDHLAAMLAWLVPGMGHLYQGRIVRGIIFLTIILGSFLYGLYLSEGNVVYFKWDEDEKRLQYFAQVGAGAIAVPGFLQWRRAGDGANLERIWDDRGGGIERKQLKPAHWLFGQFQPPPDKKELDRRHGKLSRWLDLGSLYTMTAGFLNLLVIYDALLGPACAKAD